MEFMLLFLDRRDEPAEDRARMADMREFAAGLASQGKLRRGAPLAADGAGERIRAREGKAFVTDGPFAETKEIVGGFWIIDVAGRDEAVEVARRSPHARHGVVEAHAVRSRYDFPDSGKGSPFLFAFHVEPGLTDPDGSKLHEMIVFAEELARDGKLLETAPLAKEPPPARLEPRGGSTRVTDGPFVETKEMIGGYSLVRAGDRAEAVDLAKRYPHARWGPVEVREILYFDRT